MSTLVTDTNVVLQRELKPMVRDPFSVVFSLIQPLVFLGLFGPLLDQVSGLEGDSALQWFVPGIIVMSALFATSMTGSNLQMEMQTGSHERMLVAPLYRSSLLVGRSLKEIVPVVLQAALIVLVTLPFGFRLEPVGAVLAVAIIATFGVGLGSLSHALAVASKGEDWIFWTVQQTFLFPLMLLSGMLLPIDGGPGWLQTASKFNPLTYVVEASRALFDGRIAEVAVLQGVVAAVAVCALGLAVGVRVIRSGTS